MLMFSMYRAFPQDTFSMDSALRQRILNADYQYLDGYVAQRGIDSALLGSSYNLLAFAIINDNFGLVEFALSKGANINFAISNLTPLMYCAIYNRSQIAAHLIKYGASVDIYNKHRNTPLLYAARYGNLDMVKTLSQSRANPFILNFKGYCGLDYALEYNRTEIADYLRAYMARYAKGAFPSTYDGPYVDWVGWNRLRATYLVNDSLSGNIYTVKKSFRFTDSLTISKVYTADTIDYKIYRLPRRFDPVFEYHNVSKVFAVGDVHGCYDSLVHLLIANRVIDSHLNWNFNDGHLVFIGDLFDRGSMVTQTLWLVYRLFNQAPRCGGNVHVIMGNHELLALNNDYRYLNPKYIFLTRGLNMEYSKLFSSTTILGQFVRSFKASVKIDSVLFAHAGLSDFMVNQNITLYSLNRAVYSLLNLDSGDPIPPLYPSIFSHAISEQGVFWYRGYLVDEPTVKRATPADLQRVLHFYQASAMVIGHTEVERIEPLYNGLLYPLNVPFDRVGIRKQGLLIVGKQFFRCFSDGSCEIIY